MKILPNNFKVNDNTLLVTSKQVNKFVKIPAKHTFFLKDREAGKSIDEHVRLLNHIAKGNYQRILAVGGGTVSDAAGYAAAVFKRGIPWDVIPTTLMGMVDAAHGGKTAINLKAKNQVGAYHLPQNVYINTKYLDTLPERERISGKAEIIKYAATLDIQLLAKLKGKTINITTYIETCIKLKNYIVEHDFKEKAGLREILNYGHTLGHAFEYFSKYDLTHGESVALGMIAENEISVSRNWLKREDADTIKNIIIQHGLPVKYQNLKKLSVKSCKTLLKLDKKNKGNKPRFILLHDLERTHTVDDVTDREINLALKSVYL